MNTYIVRRPIISKAQIVEAYEIVYRQDSSSLYNSDDNGAANTILNFITHASTHNFWGGKQVFLPFTPNLLMNNVQEMFSPEHIIIQLDESLLIHSGAVNKLHAMRDQGYRMALSDFDFDVRHLGILPCIDYLRVNFSSPAENKKEIQNTVSIARKLGKKTFAYNVNTPEARGKALVYGFDYFQGDSIAEMMQTKVHGQEKLQSTFYLLMQEVMKENPDFGEIERIISVDINMTYSLLKIVNSAYFGLRNTITDVRHALTILGLAQLKKWVYLMSFVPDGGLREELVKTSFLRATFCQRLAAITPHFSASENDAYLLGMFSTLDVLLNVSSLDELEDLPMSDAVREGLVDHAGQCGALLELCLAYEKGRWSKMDRCAQSLNVPEFRIADVYYESVEDVNKIWTDLTALRGKFAEK